MSPVGTKREFSPERLEGRKPPHCRRSDVYVGPSVEDRPDSEPLRMRTYDPLRSWDLGLFRESIIDRFQDRDLGLANPPLGSVRRPSPTRGELFPASVSSSPTAACPIDQHVMLNPVAARPLRRVA